MERAIKVLNIHKSYGKSVILNDLSLEIPRGKFVAIMGPSGSGKSTLLHLLGGLDKPTSGTIIIDGEDISKLSDKKLSRLRNKIIGFVFQFFYLQPFLNVANNVEIASMPSRLNTKERKKRALHILKMVGLEGKEKSLPRQLSGGEMQRVAIARAMMNQPKILIADEPTGNLDRQNSDNIINLLKNICVKNNTTVIVATHDEAVAHVADQTIIIDNGGVK
ncbi:MAG: ABC transporter ATP-binding protein [Candidatus Nomurabacteria bacterium]|nr:ABC transporter ATP-binding protein [Candidatus Nomurabacteria bacterium]